MIEIFSFIKYWPTRFIAVVVLSLLAFFAANTFLADHTGAQSVSIVSSTSGFRIGEKLTYNVSFGKIDNAGYAETHVVSRGKIGSKANVKDAIEIRSKFRTLDIFSAAFFALEENRAVFAAPDTGLPLYMTTTTNGGALPKESIGDYLTKPTSSFDLTTLIYKARESGGIGTFPLYEGEQLYTATFQGNAPEKVRVEAGDFDTTVSLVQSDFLAANGITNLKINFSADEYRVPVMIRFKHGKGDFKVTLTAIILPEPETPSPTPTPAASPKTTPPPVASPTPPQYVDNVPLSPELGFEIGEVLTYRITAAGKPVGTLTLNARERKLFEKSDSLLLTATVAGPEGGPGELIGAASVQVDPETLAPSRIESKFSTPMVGLNQTVKFDRRTGMITFGAKPPVDAPIGTQSFLSLIYAMRSFNLKPSKNLSNPVNDTRVAVFWESKSYVFTLRPSKPEEITINGEKVAAQLINVKTDVKDLDVLSLKVWLGADTRVPLRFSAGPLLAELISQTSNFSK